jgi:Amino acid synthesis
VVAAVIGNPFAGRHEPEIAAAAEALAPLLALAMAERLLDALCGGERALVEAYGKAAIMGGEGEVEHAALWHVAGGSGLRRALGGGRAIIPSTKKVGGVGARIDVPLHHKDAAYVRSHFAAMEAGVPDTPRRREIVSPLAMATGRRAHARVGGLSAAEIRGEDGLR